MSQSDQSSSKQPVSASLPAAEAVPVPTVPLPVRALSSKAAAASKSAVKVTTPVRTRRAVPPRAPLMLEVSTVTPPAPAMPNVAAPHPVEIISASAPKAPPVPEQEPPEVADNVPALLTQKTLGIGLDPSQVLRDLLAQRQQEMLRRLKKLGVQRGQILFDGRWMSADDARALFRSMRVRSWLTLVEAILLISAMVGSAGVVGILLAVLVGLRAG